MQKRLSTAVSAIGVGSLALSLLLGAAGISTAADPTASNATVHTGIPSGLSLEAQAELQKQDAWTGGFTFKADPADLAIAKANGFDLNLEESARISLAYHIANPDSGFPRVLSAAKFDIPTFKANSPYASQIDVETPVVDADGIHSAVGLSLTDDNLFSGATTVTTKEFQHKPALEEGQFTIGGAGDAGIGPTVIDHSTGEPVDTGAWDTGIYIAPSTSNHLGGVPGDKPNSTGYDQTSGGSIILETDHMDSRLPSDKRTADVSLDGTQRIQDASTRTDIVSNAGELGFWWQLTASGTRTDGSGQVGSVAVGPPIWITVETTRKQETPTFTKQNPFVTKKADGTEVKVWFTPETYVGNNAVRSGLDRYGYDFYDASVPLVATDANVLKSFQGDQFAGTFGHADISSTPTGNGFKFDTSYSSSYFSAREELTAVANDVSAEEAKVAQRQAQYDAAKTKLDATEPTHPDYNDIQMDFNTAEANLQQANAQLDTAKAKPATNYKITYSKPAQNGGSEIPKAWARNGVALEVGQTWTSTANEYAATFTVESNADGVLVIDVKVNTAPAEAPYIQSGGASIGTGLNLGGIAEVFEAPGYETYFTEEVPTDIPTPEETPDIPTPEETPEIPTPEETPKPEETPEIPVPTDTPDSTTDTVDEPGDSITDEVTEDQMAITPGKPASPAHLADTGMNEGAFSLMVLLGTLGSACLAYTARLRLKEKRLAKANS